MPSEQECQQMVDISKSPFLRAVLFFTSICCLFCVPMSLYSLLRIIKSVKLHFNSKCIFVAHNLAVLTHCLIRLILHGKDLFNYLAPFTSGCDIMPSRSRCDLRMIYKITQYIIEISPIILTMERFMATFRARSYENRYKWLGVSLFAVHMLLAMVMVLVQNSNKSGDVIIYYCWLSSTGNRYSINAAVYLVLSSQLATIPALLFILRKNEVFLQQYRQTSLHRSATLTQRYQIFENLRTINMFRIMSVVTWFYVSYNALATYVVHFWLEDMAQAGQFGSIELIHCLPLYYIILSLLVLREDKKPSSKFAIKVDNYHPHHYFNELQKFFDEAFEKINIKSSNRIGPKV